MDQRRRGLAPNHDPTETIPRSVFEKPNPQIGIPPEKRGKKTRPTRRITDQRSAEGNLEGSKRYLPLKALEISTSSMKPTPRRPRE
jgi:hypothetical protein